MVFGETPPGIHCYIFITYGYHVQDFIRHLFVPRDNDWREMFLHHLCAVALYPGFLFGNIMGIGVFLAWLHDIADVPCNLCRMFLQMKWEKMTFLFYVTLMTLWAYTRLYILPWCIYIIFTEVYYPPHLSHF